MVVEQECPSVTPDAPLQFLHVSLAVFLVGIVDVHAVVVVAHHGIDTVGGIEAAEVALKAVEFSALVVDQVACEEDGIALLGVDEVNDDAGIGLVSIAQGADVHVGEVCDAIAFKLFGQVREVECLPMHHVMVASLKVAETEEAEGEEAECHADDAEDAHEKAIVVLTVLGSTRHHPVDAVSESVEHHEQGFGRTEEEEDEHVDADPRLMLGLHVVAAHDDDCGHSKGERWHEPQPAQPCGFCPMSHIHEVDVGIGQREQQDDEYEYS